MTKNFNELRKKMDPSRVEKNKKEAKDLLKTLPCPACEVNGYREDCPNCEGEEYIHE